MLFVILFLFLIIVIVAVDRSIKVASVMTLMWFFLVGISVIYFRSDQLPEKGLGYILAVCALFWVSEWISGNISVFDGIKEDNIFQATKLVKNTRTLAFFAITGIIYLMVQTLYSGISIGGLQGLAGSTYHVDTEGSMLSKIVNAFCFSFFALDGFVVFYKKSLGPNDNLEASKYNSFFPLLILLQLMMAIVSSQKSAIIWSVIFWASGIMTGIETFVSREKQSKAVTEFIKQNLKIIILLLIGFIAALFLLFFVRHRGTMSETIDLFMLYGFAEVPVFSIWLDKTASLHLQHSMGGQTFYGIVKLFVNVDHLSINWPLDPATMALGVVSNIFTAFRGLIEDFGIKGSLFFWIIMGLITGQADRRTNTSIIKITFILSAFVFILFTFLISAWHYTTVFIACLFFLFDLLFITCISRRNL